MNLWKRQLVSDNSQATIGNQQLGSDNLEASTWKQQRTSKRQLASDNLKQKHKTSAVLITLTCSQKTEL